MNWEQDGVAGEGIVLIFERKSEGRRYQDVAFVVRQALGLHEADLVSQYIRMKYAGDLFHLLNRRLVAVAIACAGHDRKGHTPILERELGAFDNLVAQTTAG